MDSHQAVTDAIRKGCKTRTMILEYTSLSDSKVKRTIGDLVESNYIRKENPNKSDHMAIHDE